MREGLETEALGGVALAAQGLPVFVHGGEDVVAAFVHGSGLGQLKEKLVGVGDGFELLKQVTGV